MTQEALRRVRRWLFIFITGVVLSGLTAFPLETETRWLSAALRASPAPACAPGLVAWVERVHAALAETGERHPFLAYGTDWLAFAHLAIALGFVGVWREPRRNAWLVDWGLLCCGGVVPLALICAGLRGIPMAWRLIDMSFGVPGAVPLIAIRRELPSDPTAGAAEGTRAPRPDGPG